MAYIACFPHQSTLLRAKMPFLASRKGPDLPPAAKGFSLGDYVSEKIELVNKSLSDAVPLRRPLSLHQSMRHTLFSPRCRRPCAILSLASCELLGRPDLPALPAACAAEMLYASASIVDDLPCLDDDHLRLGAPANHVVFGEDVAVLAASALVSLSFHHLVDRSAGAPVDRVAHAVAELAKAFGPQGLTAGQVVDMESEGKEVSVRDVMRIHEQKTGKLFEASAVCGAIAGGGEEGEVERVRRYARRLGLAYQVMDDVLDVTSTPEALGKEPGRDPARDKATYPKLVGVRRAREFAREMAERAVEELAAFDPVRAAPLYHLALSLLDEEGKE